MEIITIPVPCSQEIITIPVPANGSPGMANRFIPSHFEPWNLAGIEMRSVSIFGKFHNPPLGKDGFSLELYTRLHGFKYEFSKIF